MELLLSFLSSFQEAKALLRRHKLESHLLQVAAAGLGYTYTEPVTPGSALTRTFTFMAREQLPLPLSYKLSPLLVTQELDLGPVYSLWDGKPSKEAIPGLKKLP